MRKTPNLRTRPLVLILLSLSLLLCAGSAAAQMEIIRVEGEGPVDLRADRVEYDQANSVYTVEGEVEIVRGETRLFADKVMLNSQTLLARAEGNVRLTTPGQVLTGDRMDVNLEAETGKIFNGRIFVTANHFYISGEEIEKTGPDTYAMKNGSLTSCDGENPAWKFTGEEIDITIEGYGTVKNSTFRIKDIPVLYTPYLAFPVKFKRQSGLLAPQFGQSDRDGFTFSLPYYQTLGESQDLTLTLNYMTKRGVSLGGEYRYNLAPGSKGILMVDGMPKDDMGQELFDKGDNADVYESRYWVRAKADQKLFNDRMTMKLDLDLVSDEDYTREFDFGYSGFNQSQNRMQRWMGRDMDSRTTMIRKNQLNFQQSWDTASFNGTLLYYDNLTNDNKSTLQSLPTISYDATRQAVGNTGLYFRMNSDYTYYYREEGSTGHIADISPALSLPLNFNDYYSIEPTFTYMPRAFSVKLDDSEDPANKKSGFSQLWKFKVESSTYLYRVYGFGDEADPYKVKHALRPFIDYNYQPSENDEDTASLARRTQKEINTLSYGIKNSFTGKTLGATGADGEALPVYREFLRLNLSHSFDIKEYQRDPEEGTGDTRYWGLVNGRIEFDPSQYIYFESDLSWNLYNNRFQTLNAEAIVKDKRGDSISLDYRNTYDSVNQLSSKLKLAVNDEWSLNYINRHDFEEGNNFENTFEVRYQGQCWGVRAYYTETLRERGFFVAFSLGGLGELFGFGRNTDI